MVAGRLRQRVALPNQDTIHFDEASTMATFIYLFTVVFFAYVIYVILGDQISDYLKNNFRR